MANDTIWPSGWPRIAVDDHADGVLASMVDLHSEARMAPRQQVR